MAKHIIFDCDGVLIDTEIVAAEVVSRFLRSAGVRISTEEFIERYTGKTFTDIIELLKAGNELPKAFDTAAAVPALDQEIRNNQRPINGAPELLGALNLPFSVVSNSAGDYVHEALEKLEVLHLVEERIFSAEQVAKGKPSPLVYQFAMEQIKHAPEDVLVIEDSLSGVMASTAAGIKTIGFLGGSHIRKGHAEKLMALGCHETVNTHAELAQLLAGH